MKCHKHHEAVTKQAATVVNHSVALFNAVNVMYTTPWDACCPPPTPQCQNMASSLSKKALAANPRDARQSLATQKSVQCKRTRKSARPLRKQQPCSSLTPVVTRAWDRYEQLLPLHTCKPSMHVYINTSTHSLHLPPNAWSTHGRDTGASPWGAMNSSESIEPIQWSQRPSAYLQKLHRIVYKYSFPATLSSHWAEGTCRPSAMV
jgi:hypothetical protein